MDRIVVDLEWNQPKVMKKRVRGLIGEIIQIGAAKIDADTNVISTFEQIIKPEYYRSMNKDIAELTLISDADLEKGISFADAVAAFREWCGEEFTFITWGPDDYRVLDNNLGIKGLDRGWLPPCVDAQLVFDDQEMGEGRNYALNYALFHFKEKPDGAHNALADVLSTVAVLKHLDMDEALSDEYFRCDFGDEDDNGEG